MIKKLSKNDIWPHIRNIAEKPQFFWKLVLITQILVLHKKF